MITDNYVLLGNMQVLVWLALVLTVGGIASAVVFGLKHKKNLARIVAIVSAVLLIGTFALYQGKKSVERQIAIDMAFFDGQGKSIDEILEEFKVFVGQD